jgi:hypothetical protein
MPPKEAVAEVMGSSTGQRAIAVARPVRGRPSNWHGERFWARGSAVSTVGCEEAPMRASRKQQEQRDAQGAGGARGVLTTSQLTLAALRAAHNRQAPRFAGAL